MWTCGFAFSINLFVALASELETFDHNDWVPVNNDIIYNQIRQGFTQAPRFTKADEVLNTNIQSVVSPDQFKRHNDIRTEEVTEENVDVLYNEDSTSDVQNTLIDERLSQYKNDMSNKFTTPAKQNVKAGANIRRSKKLGDIDLQILFLKDILLSKYYTSEHNKLLKREDIKPVNNNAKDNIDTYKVTETIEDEKQKESQAEINGYEYKQPEKQNFTTDLIKNLSKYNNINIDNLQNYALSRRPRAKSPPKQDILQRSPHFRVPIRYNSLEHLPVDPMLAVFLSNYGYYLQGQYGISNNYKNWYGYLASNNIHNNRPFGFYKLFSDTDSSNK